jgi:Skp family chaperone for outer membrane proteins
MSNNMQTDFDEFGTLFRESPKPRSISRNSSSANSQERVKNENIQRKLGIWKDQLKKLRKDYKRNYSKWPQYMKDIQSKNMNRIENNITKLTGKKYKPLNQKTKNYLKGVQKNRNKVITKLRHPAQNDELNDMIQLLQKL